MGDIVSESPGDFISVHPGDFVGIRRGVYANLYRYWIKIFAVVFGARKLRALEDENVKLKKLLGEAMLDNAILKDVAAKNV